MRNQKGNRLKKDKPATHTLRVRTITPPGGGPLFVADLVRRGRVAVPNAVAARFDTDRFTLYVADALRVDLDAATDVAICYFTAHLRARLKQTTLLLHRSPYSLEEAIAISAISIPRPRGVTTATTAVPMYVFD